MKHLPTIALLVTCCIAPLPGATLERLSLDDMITKSTAIVRGNVTQPGPPTPARVIYTHYKIQVSERFKGAPQKLVEVAVPGGTIDELHQTQPGSPVLNQGDEYVFFLWTGKSGMTWITGLTQGLFSMSMAQSADPTAWSRRCQPRTDAGPRHRETGQGQCRVPQTERPADANRRPLGQGGVQ